MLTFISEDELKTWLIEHQLLWDDQWGTVEFPQKTEGNRFWVLPNHGARTVYLLFVVLASIDPWNQLVICKKGATGWYSSEENQGIVDAVRDKIIASTGVGNDFRGAILAGHADLANVVTLLFNQTLFGWCQWDDVYVIPDHANQIVMTSHHDVIDVDFRDAERIESFVAALSKEEFPLPTKVPDGTFDTPDWMRPPAQ